MPRTRKVVNFTISEYQALVEENTRSDGWVNVSKWCKAFNTRWAKFTEREEYNSLIDNIRVRENVRITDYLVEASVGRGHGTFVHPTVALAVAHWLSPAFYVESLIVLRRVTGKDLTLATELVTSSVNIEAVKKHVKEVTEYVDYLDSYHELFDKLMRRGFSTDQYKGINAALNRALGVRSGMRKDLDRNQYFVLVAIEKAVMTALEKNQKLSMIDSYNLACKTIAEVGKMFR